MGNGEKARLSLVSPAGRLGKARWAVLVMRNPAYEHTGPTPVKHRPSFSQFPRVSR